MFKNIQNFFSIPKDDVSIPRFLILILIAYIFSVALRFVWVYQFSGNEQFYWNGQLMINTNDGYLFAEGARDILNGKNSPYVNLELSKLTALMYKITPFSFETLILHMPTIFGSMLVVPVLLIGRILGYSFVGFVAALLAGIAWSYYNRTMTGYYDTDLLVVLSPTLLVCSFIYTLAKRTDISLLAPFFVLVLLGNWHSSMIYMSVGVLYLVAAYTVLLGRKEMFNYKLIAALSIMISGLGIYLKLVLVAALVGSFIYLKDFIDHKKAFIIAISAFLLYLLLGGFATIANILGSGYVTRVLVADEINLSLKFYNVVNTVREAGHIDFTTFANRISGHKITLFASIVGYVIFCVRHPLLLLSVPMVVLGFFAIQGGLRFTVFAVPFMALGVAYLIFFIAKFVQPIPRVAIISILSAAVLYPNIKHIQEYMTPTVMNKNEVEVLDKLKSISKEGDYVISWWDYGYPIRYYSYTETLCDGGRHDGNENFIASYILNSQNQLASSNLSRLVSEVDKKYIKGEINTTGGLTPTTIRESGFKNPKDFLNALNSPMQLPPKTRDVFIYLPFRMFEIFPTVKLFSNLDLETGRTHPQPLFYFAQGFQKEADGINLGSGIKLYEQGGMLQVGGQKLQIKNFVQTFYTNDGKLNKNVQTINPNSPISVIYMQSYNAFLVVDEAMYSSLFVQLFALENFDPNLFEPVIMTPLSKVYKLKI